MCCGGVAFAQDPPPAMVDVEEVDEVTVAEVLPEFDAAAEAVELPSNSANPFADSGPTPAPMLNAGSDDVPPPALAPRQDVEVPESLPDPTPRPPTREVTFPTAQQAAPDGPSVMIGRPVERPDYGADGNRQAARLRSFPPETFNFDRASLRDVLRLLAEQAGIPYIGIPEHSPQAQRLVTLRMTASPFAALQSVARQNGILLSYEDGVWFLRVSDPNFERARAVENENELVAVVYQLKHDPVDRVSFRTEDQGGRGLGLSGSRDSAAAPTLSLQQPQRVFEVRAPRIVREIRTMLGMDPYEAPEPPAVAREVLGGGGAGTTGMAAGVGGASGVDGAGRARQGSEAPQRASLPPADGARSNDLEVDNIFPLYVPPQETQVIYNSDTNILWVVATRKQHRWVADYLKRVDKPQDLIAIEVKFFETRKNPRADFGINWANTLGTGLTVGGQASIGSADGIGSIDFFNSRQRGENRGDLVGRVDEQGNPSFELSPPGRVDNNLRGSSVSGNIPYSAVLSLNEFSFTMQAFMEDRDSSLVQYPRVLTVNNREVAITSAENTPVNAGVQTVQSGGSSSQPVGTLEYVPVGTQINILPKSVGQNQIALTVAITISQIVDFVSLNLGTGENLYPVTTQRVYNANLQVDSGYTLAVGGLEKVADRNSTGGIPVLRDIPGLGYLFKNKSRSRDTSNLIIFITPYLISDPAETPGISERPEAVIPLRPGTPPPPPEFNPDGTLVGGEGKVAEALAWLSFQQRYFRQTNLEGRTDGQSVHRLQATIRVARDLDSYLADRVQADGGYFFAAALEQAEQAQSLLLALNRTLAAAQADQRQEWLP
jgi:type II secretory pathway component GspD/PulD (secretin)